MAKIEVYSSSTCPYCHAAIRLLGNKGVEFDQYSVDGAPEVWREMEERSGRRTVPQIFIDNRHIGGFDDLADLDADDELDALLR